MTRVGSPIILSMMVAFILLETYSRVVVDDGLVVVAVMVGRILGQC